MSSQGKIKRNIEKTRSRIKKITAELQQYQDKSKQCTENNEKLTEIVRDIQKQHTDLQQEYANKKTEFELKREDEKQKLDQKLIAKNLELKNLKENIEEINRRTEDEILALEIYQKTISLQCQRYNNEIQQAMNEVQKLTTELSHYENPSAAAGDFVMAKLFKQIHQKEQQQRLSRQIDTLTRMKNNLETEIRALEQKLEESGKRESPEQNPPEKEEKSSK